MPTQIFETGPLRIIADKILVQRYYITAYSKAISNLFMSIYCKILLQRHIYHLV
jgi:hypothetical protein